MFGKNRTKNVECFTYVLYLNVIIRQVYDFFYFVENVDTIISKHIKPNGKNM